MAFFSKMFRRKLFHIIADNSGITLCSRGKADGRAIGTLFFEPNVQGLLKKLSCSDLDKVFTVQKNETYLSPPEYKFMTDEELKNAFVAAEEKANIWQQMPPILDPRNDEVTVICEDPALDGHDEQSSSSHVFSDITFGVPEQDRLIVVRQSDGKLRHANWNERHRVNEIYSPRPGREMVAPQMFYGEHLEGLLDRQEYKFVLDRACAQYEPNDPEYIRVTSTTYDRVAKEQHFDSLRSTRHFGSMIFYLAFNKQIDTLLLDNLQTLKLDDAISIVHLYHMIHPDCPSAQSTVGSEDADIIRIFIEQDANNKGALDLALRKCLQHIKDKNNDVERIHGITRV